MKYSGNSVREWPVGSVSGYLVQGAMALVLWLTTSFALAAAATFSEMHDGIWTEVLQKYVDDDGFVRYDDLLQNRQAFDGYINLIETVGPKSNPSLFPTRDHELAYYINAYNAHVFNGVLNRGPEKESVWKGLISGLNFFVRMDIIVDGRKTNLKNLEDDIVRERFNDPRIHAALNCASIGCPRLIREAYTPGQLDSQLESATREFLNGALHVQVDAEKRIVRLSKIFDWFEKDFLQYEEAQGTTQHKKSATLIHYVNRYRSSEEQIPLDYKIRILKYDKRINRREG